MAGGGLQVVDAALLVVLHDATLQLGNEVRRRFAGDWRRGMEPRARAAATIASATVATQLMEAMSWLLTAQAVAADEIADPGPAVWRAGPAPGGLTGIHGDLAAAVDRLYRRIVTLDAEIR